MNTIQKFCDYCTQPFEPVKPWQRFCSPKCSYTLHNYAKRQTSINESSCVRCGANMAHKRIDAIYCSKSCQSMDYVFHKRPKTRVTTISRRRIIFERDFGRCYMCLRNVPSNKFHLDHLVPVSRDGDNSETNLAVSCPDCNRRRGSRIGLLQLSKLLELRKTCPSPTAIARLLN
jgi:5-methylcytosine-specific restriction endonuclease McrA